MSRTPSSGQPQAFDMDPNPSHRTYPRRPPSTVPFLSLTSHGKRCGQRWIYALGFPSCVVAKRGSGVSQQRSLDTRLTDQTQTGADTIPCRSLQVLGFLCFCRMEVWRANVCKRAGSSCKGPDAEKRGNLNHCMPFIAVFTPMIAGP